MIDLERHRLLIAAALHSHAEHLDDELFKVQGLSNPTDRVNARQRINRDRADALDLARDLESS